MATVAEGYKPAEFSKSSADWPATRFFSSNDATSAADAVNATGVPNIDDDHPDEPRTKCSSKAARQISPTYFEITVRYRIPADGTSHGGPNDDPLNNAPIIRWDIGSETVQIDRDRDNNPILNSAGDPFDTGIFREETTIFFTYTRWERFFDLARALQFSNTVNSDAIVIRGVGGLSPGQIKCRTITPAEANTAGATSLAIAYSFELRADGFQSRLRDQGFYTHTSVSGDTVRTEIKSKTVEPVTAAVMLDGSGKTIEDKWTPPKSSQLSPPTAVAGATASSLDGLAFYLTYNKYREEAFVGLQF